MIEPGYLQRHLKYFEDKIGDSAFPVSSELKFENESSPVISKGLSKREYMATQALIGFLADKAPVCLLASTILGLDEEHASSLPRADLLAQISVKMADALLFELGRTK